MRIVHLHIENFRGIRSLDWKIDRDLNCLVGPGDSTKTTILDAIDLVLSPRWNVAFVDSDFYDCNYESAICVRAVVSDPPKSLIAEDKFGLYQCAFDSENGELVELEEDSVPVLAVELRVTGNLEPEWHVVAPGREARHISSKDRESLAVTRLGEFVDRHVTWSRGSSLARMGEGTKTVREVIAEAQRSAMKAVRDLQGTSLHDSAKTIETLGRELGVSPRSAYVPGLDAKTFGEGSVSLALHDGDVPVRMCGLGTRRLLAAAIQKRALKSGGAIVIDEVEHGLEPHRILHLIRTLTKPSDEGKTQLFASTHSPTAVAEFGASGLCVVRCDNGQSQVLGVPTDDEMQGMVRGHPEALLAKVVVVAEGATEGGLLWAFDRFSQGQGRNSFGLIGAVVLDGGGRTVAPGRALALRRLGFQVAYFGDSDEPPQPSKEEMEQDGVRVFMWPDSMFTELRILTDLPAEALSRAFALACEYFPPESCVDQVKTQLAESPARFDGDINAWLEDGDESKMRIALAKAATPAKKERGWFKSWDRGSLLGDIVFENWDAMDGRPTRKSFEDFANWLHKE